MKKLAALVALLGIAAGSGVTARAVDLTFTNNGVAPKSVVNAVLCSTTNADLDLNANGIDAASVQIVYSSAGPSNVTFKDGTTSTGSITVASLAGLTTAYASNNITIASNTAVAGSILTINGYPYTEGKNWNYNVGQASNTAIALCKALQVSFGSIFKSTVTLGQSVIYSSAVAAGSAANTFTMVSSTQAALTVASPTFINGNDNAVLTIGGRFIVANVDYFPITSAGAAATSLATAINKYAGLAAQAIGAVVTTTSTVVGSFANYAMTTSTTALTLSSSTMVGGTDSDISLNFTPAPLSGIYNSGLYPPAPLAYSTIYKAPTGMGTAFPMLFTTSAGTAPGGLTTKTTYYASNLTSTNFQLSDTSTGAAAGLFIAITTTTQTGGGSFLLAPLPLTGTPAFKLQASNDGTNFQDVYVTTGALTTPIAANIAIPSPYTAGSILWNLGDVFYRYLRLAVSSIGSGGLSVNEIVNAKNK